MNDQQGTKTVPAGVQQAVEGDRETRGVVAILREGGSGDEAKFPLWVGAKQEGVEVDLQLEFDANPTVEKLESVKTLLALMIDRVIEGVKNGKI